MLDHCITVRTAVRMPSSCTDSTISCKYLLTAVLDHCISVRTAVRMPSSSKKQMNCHVKWTAYRIDIYRHFACNEWFTCAVKCISRLSFTNFTYSVYIFPSLHPDLPFGRSKHSAVKRFLQVFAAEKPSKKHYL